jgi:hypothetical protein
MHWGTAEGGEAPVPDSGDQILEVPSQLIIVCLICVTVVAIVATQGTKESSQGNCRILMITPVGLMWAGRRRIV